MANSKICFKCSKHLPLTEFYKHQAMADGHLGKCKTCTKSDVAEHRLNNLEKIRQYDRIRAKYPERAKYCAEITKAWRSSDKRIMQCHSKVARAVKNGILVRQPCEICGSEKSIAHHESYNRPLDVRWLCEPHHKERHKQMVLADIDPLSEE